MAVMADLALGNAFDSQLNDYQHGIIDLAERVAPDEVDEVMVAILSYGPSWGMDDPTKGNHSDEEPPTDTRDDQES